MRKLVTIEKIKEIVPIADADAIEIAVVKGWQAVVKKDQFKVGDHCVFFEVDSFLPVKPEYEFLRKGCFRSVVGLGDGFRIRTMKLRKQLSQGLILPLGDVNLYQESEDVIKFTNSHGNTYFVNDETDLAELLEVKKWEPPVPASLAGRAEGYFPNYIKKTDQERIQNIFDSEKHHILGKMFEVTLKLDGSSMTAFKTPEKFGVCSRNLELKVDESNAGNSFVSMAGQLNLAESLPEGYAIQGELMGPGIQGNREKLLNPQFYVFDIQNIKSGTYLTPDERKRFMEINLPQVAHVPVVEERFYMPSMTSLQDLLDWADAVKSITHEVAEGLVFKRLDGEYSFKVISNKFLLKEE